MKNNYKIHLMFPIPVFTSIVPPKYSYLLDFLELQKIKEPLVQGSLEFGRRSENSYILNQPPLLELSKYILKEVLTYGKQCLNYTYDEYRFSQSWISHKYPGEKHVMHTHPNSLISGVFYYGKTDDKIPSINFHKPNFNDITRPKINPISQNDYTYTATKINSQPGTLVLFPSELPHSVPINKTNLIRKSLAFNVVPKEGFGSEEELTELKFN